MGQATGQQRLTIFGHSFGSLLALSYYKKYPGHVKKLILTGSFPPYTQEGISGFIKTMRPRQQALRDRTAEIEHAWDVACLIVALFGAPLAVTNPRAGAAMGLAIALGTTLIYLTGTQIMKAIGGKEIIPVVVAAWSMNGLFLVLAVILLVRVRS